MKLFAAHATRRLSLGLFAAGFLRFPLSGEDAAAKSSKRGKGKKTDKDKGKRKNKGKRNPEPAASCSGGSCVREFATGTDRDSCEFICRQCDVAGRQFCITESDPYDPAKVAACCGEGLRCCGGTRFPTIATVAGATTPARPARSASEAPAFAGTD